MEDHRPRFIQVYCFICHSWLYLDSGHSPVWSALIEYSLIFLVHKSSILQYDGRTLTDLMKLNSWYYISYLGYQIMLLILIVSNRVVHWFLWTFGFFGLLDLPERFEKKQQRNNTT